VICFELQCSEALQTAHTTIFHYTIDKVPFWMRYYMRTRTTSAAPSGTSGSCQRMTMECSHGCKPIKSGEALKLLTARHDAPSVLGTGPCTACPSLKRLFTPSLCQATPLGLPPVVTRGVHMRERGRRAVFIWFPGPAHGIVSTPTRAENAVPGVVDGCGWWPSCSRAPCNGWKC